MPIYEYRCDNGHLFEVVQRMSDDPLTTCQVCEAPVRKVLHPVAVHFKGSGFYTTDYGKKKTAGAASDGKKDKPESNGSGDGGSSDKPSSDSAGSDKPKSAAKSGD